MRTGEMNKVSMAVLAGFAAVAAAIVALPRGDYRLSAAASAGSAKPPAPAAEPEPAASSEAAAEDAGAPVADPAQPAEDEPGVEPGVEPVEEAAESGASLPDGSAVPELSGAPKSVTFGVVLVQFAGAQGAPGNARSKAAALTLATELAELAKEDFAAAVKRGDPGSAEDAGKMFRRILEPAAEYALFSLDKNGVGGPVETPRGFWIVRRIK